MKPYLAPVIFAVVGLVPLSSWAAQTDPAGIEYFEKNVRPIFADNCYRCHSHSASKPKGGLMLDSMQGILRGGDDGPAIVPGSPDQSPLISAIRREDKESAMPPKGNGLSEAQINSITEWVKMGAPGPVEQVAAGQGVNQAAHDPTADYDRLRHTLWSWQPIKVSPPATGPYQEWARDELDRYVLAVQSPRDLRPSPEADRATLIRRATFDLIGIPPTPAEIAAFVADKSPDAFEKVVDRLLASPEYGQRWGRHWLDVARYAESTGNGRNYPYYYAWRYRDYVINAFNNDKPFNRFITEQLAGDQLPAESPEQRDRQIIATGFLAIGTRDYTEKDPRQFLMNNVDEQIDVTGRAFLATTISCARCHDHKFDPIPTKQYYGMAGIFTSTQTFTGLQRTRAAMKLDFFDTDFLIPLSNYKPRGSSTPYAGVNKKELRQLTKNNANNGPLNLPAEFFEPVPEENLAMGARDVRFPRDTNVLIRGDVENSGPVTPRGFLTIPCMAESPAIDARTSGRLQLAEWITQPNNPLTSRVIVNRIWKHLFGQGIVRTIDNFGESGDQPDNPQLLDYLASDFMKNGWSIKKEIREIMLSSSYRQSSALDNDKFALDPDNHLLWRQNPRRLEAEAIRDSLLFVGGNLNPQPMHSSVIMKLSPLQIIRSVRKGFDMDDNSTYRSVYLPIYRQALPEVLDTFDVADPDFVTGDREVTTVPPQALYLMNSPFVLDQADKLARRVETTGRDPALTDEINLAYKLSLGREPSGQERARAVTFIRTYAQSNSSAYARANHAGLTAFCQALFCSAEFRYLN